MFGFRIVESTRFAKYKWVFPRDRFVEWGPEDESYCRWAQYGHEELIHQAIRIGDALYMHPLTAAELRKQITQYVAPFRPVVSMFSC